MEICESYLNLLLDFIPQMNSSVWSFFFFEHWIILLVKVYVYVYANLKWKCKQELG